MSHNQKNLSQFHFNLTPFDLNSDFTLNIGLSEYALVKHDASSLAILKERPSIFSLLPEDNLSHYVDIPKNLKEACILMSVTKKVLCDGHLADQQVALIPHIPDISFKLFLANNADAVTTLNPRWKRLGILEDDLKTISISEEEAMLSLQRFKDPTESAIALLMHHPSLLHLRADSEYPAWIKQHLLVNNPHLWELVDEIEELGEDWKKVEPLLDKDGQPVPDPDNNGRPLYTETIHERVLEASEAPEKWAVHHAHVFEKLKDEVWTQEYGTPNDRYKAEVIYPDQQTASAEGREEDHWVLKNLTPSFGLAVEKPKFQNEKLSVTGWNKYPRHLGTFVDFLDPNGNKVHLSEAEWSKVTGFLFRDILKAVLTPEQLKQIEPEDQTRFLGYALPSTMVCGINVGLLFPDATRYDFRLVRDEIATVRVLWGGLGQPTDAGAQLHHLHTVVGAFLTIIMDFSIPILFWIVGGLVDTNAVFKELLKHKKLFTAIISLGLLYVTGKTIKEIALGRNPVLRVLLPLVGLFLPGLLITKLGPILLKKIGEGTLGKLLNKILPGSSAVLKVINTIITGSAISQVTASIFMSPGIHRIEFQRSLDLKLKLHPDPRSGRFPDQATQFKVSINYNHSVTGPAVEEKYDLEGPTRSKPFDIAMSDLPAAGKLQIVVGFYSDSGWLAGEGKSPWMPAKGNEGKLLKLEITITTRLVPLTADTVYAHKQKTLWKNSKLEWQATAEGPTATRTSTSPYPGKEIVTVGGQISMAQYPATCGYFWQVRGLPGQPGERYTVQTMSTLEDPQTSHWHPEQGTRLPGGVVLDMISPDDSEGRNFYIDPSKGTFHPDKNPEGGFHLRKMELKRDQQPQVDMTKSYGRFVLPAEKFAIHPAGYVFGINYNYSRLEICRLVETGQEDKNAPQAVITSGEGFRDGLMNGPRGIGVTLDGRIIILESKNKRVQAFDLHGNPVKCFGSAEVNASSKASFLLQNEGEALTYLDLAVEGKGYIYVLSHADDGLLPSQYHLDIYEPRGAFLCRTSGISAAKIAVSIFRNLYTMNFEIMLGPRERPEPTISLWVPSAPDSSLT